MNHHAHSSRFAGRSLIAALLGALVCWAAPAGAGQVPLSDPNLRFVGRWDKSNSTQYTSYFPGAYLTTRFTGSTVKLNLGPTPTTFRYVIDGVSSTYWNGAGKDVNLTTTPLSSGTHTLQIAAEWENTELQVQGLVLDENASTQPPDARPLIEFVGDSITTGYSSKTTALTSYAWRAAEQLGADHTQIAYPSITLVQGYHYSYNHLPGMETLYTKLQAGSHCLTFECTNVPAWNFANYTPKLVVVNLGTNDNNTGTPRDKFQDTYTRFLASIRARFPDAEIFAMVPFGQYYAEQTVAAVNARLAAGDAKVHYIKTEGWLSASDFADGVHPTDGGHAKAAQQLVSHLQPYMAAVTSVNDTQFGFDSTANWPYGWQSGAFQGDNHWSNVPGASYQVPFSGTQVKLYGGRAPMHGIAAVSIDGGAETYVDSYAATRTDGALLWTSPVLPGGTHSLKVRVAGMKNVGASNTYVTADRVDIIDGGLNLVKNPGFENQLNGWSLSPAGAPQVFVQPWRANAGTSHLVHWSGTPYQAATYQNLTGLANGLYTARAWVRASGGQEFYVKDFGGSRKSVIVPAATQDAYREVVIRDIEVTNGSAQIGISTNDARGGAWLDADDVTFYRQ